MSAEEDVVVPVYIPEPGEVKSRVVRVDVEPMEVGMVVPRVVRAVEETWEVKSRVVRVVVETRKVDMVVPHVVVEPVEARPPRLAAPGRPRPMTLARAHAIIDKHFPQVEEAKKAKEALQALLEAKKECG